MKKLYILLLTTLLMTACAEEVSESNKANFITFNVTENNLLPEPTVTTSAAEVPSFFNQNSTTQTTVTAPTVSAPQPVEVETDLQLDEPLYMYTTIEKGIHATTSETSTMRGTLVNTGGTINFGVTEFPAGSNTAVTGFNNPKSFSTTSNETTAQTVNTGLTWEDNATVQKYDFYAYAPYLSASNHGLSLTNNNKSISYNSKADGLTINDQQDLMTAVAEDVNYTTSGVNLTFNHQLTAVKIVLSDTWSAYTITSVKFSSIYYKGTVDMKTGSWTYSDTDKGDYEITGTYNSSNKEIVAYLMMIPQALATNMMIKFKDGNNQEITFTVPLATTWAAGSTVTYTIGAQGITTFKAVYPNRANGTAWGSDGVNTGELGPVSTYQNTEYFGLFAVDKNTKKVVYSNIKMKSKSSSAEPELIAVDASNNDITSKYFLSKNYTYFIYYPWKDNVTGAPAVGSDATSALAALNPADTFLQDIATNWSVSATQNTETAWRAQDLQIGGVTGTSGTLSIPMKHKMGLAIITLATKNVPTVQYFNASNAILSGTTDGTTTSVTASSTFSTNIPWINSTTKKCFAIISEKEKGRTYIGTGVDGWATSYTTPSVSSGSVYTFTADSKRTFIRKGWQYECVGAVQTFTAPVAGDYKLEAWGAGAGQDFTVNAGGYAYGDITRSVNSNLFICVGGFGGDAGSVDAYETIGVTNYTNTVRAYNGGGGINASGGWLWSANPGGGATHIATTNRGVLKNYKSYQSEVLLVAGGSGGNEWQKTGTVAGGTGGGTTGGNGGPTKISTETASYYGTGGTASAGGTSRDGVTGATTGLTTLINGDFGQGGIAARSGDHGAGGGGGWYGGGGTAYAGGGGGGSGHIGSGFISGSTGMQNGVKTGHGRARVTCLFNWTF